MPLTLSCKQCAHKTVGTYADKCFKCGAVDWQRDHSSTSIAADFRKNMGGLVSLFTGLFKFVGGVLLIGVGLAVLWGVIAVIHWMWDHS
jgi:hypothetical protein